MAENNRISIKKTSRVLAITCVAYMEKTVKLTPKKRRKLTP